MGNYCSVTGELREWAKKLIHWWYDPVKDEYTYTTGTMPPSTDAVRLDERLVAIADLINEKHDAAMARLYRDMADADYMELPKDVDGKYWHIGDKAKSVRFPESRAKTVCGFGTLNGKPVLFYKSDNGGHSSNPHQGWDYADQVRHYHKPTVEDVLHSFICDIEEGMRIEDDIIAEYAAKLRLAGSDAE